MPAFTRGAVALCLLVGAFVLFLSGVAAPQNNNCTEFGFQIAGICCCTNNCCAEARDGEFQHIGGNQYRSVETGQVIERTGWSPDGRTVKCACDLIEGKWTKHPKANVRCLFVPMPNS